METEQYTPLRLPELAAKLLKELGPASEILCDINDQGFVTLTTNHGVVLNSLLTPKSKIKQDEKRNSYTGWWFGDTLHINARDAVKHTVGKAILAHEFGHNDIWLQRYDHDEVLEMQLLNSYSRSGEPLENLVSQISKVARIVITTELEAWESGIPVAKLIGVPERVFESVRAKALELSFLTTLETLAERLEFFVLSNNQFHSDFLTQSMEIFHPFEGEQVKSIGELIDTKLTKKMIEDGEHQLQLLLEK